MDGSPSESSETHAAQPDTDTTAVRDFPAEGRSQGRQFWLTVLGAFLFGVAGVLLVVIARRAREPSQPPAAAPQASSLPAPFAPSPPTVPQAFPTTPAASAPVPTAEPIPAAAPPTDQMKPAPSSAPTPAAPVPPAPAAAEKVAGGLGEAATDEVLSPSDLRRNCLEVDAEGKGKARAVAAACRPALAADPKDAEVMVILARAEIDRGRLGEARNLARKALAVDPTRAEAYVYLGTAEQEAGKIEDARAAYKRYLELAPDGRFAREIRAILNNL